MAGERRDWLADAEGTSRRLAAGLGLSPDAALYGDICQTCDARWSLSADRASCPHLPICEDCYPNGCEACEWQEHETLRHREHNSNRIIRACVELVDAADELNTTDLRSLDWRTRADVLKNLAEARERMRFVRDTLRRVDESELAE